MLGLYDYIMALLISGPKNKNKIFFFASCNCELLERVVVTLTYCLVLTFEEARHATAAAVVIESSSFDEKEVL